MKRWLPVVTVAFLAFAAMLALTYLTLRTEFMSNDTVTLWAGAIAAGGGEVPLGRILAVYPSIPFLATTLLEILTPAGAPTPIVLAALLLALIAAVFFLALRQTGVGLVAAIAATVLIAFHPALIRAAIAGPADMFLVAFLFLLAKGLYDLRAQSGAPEVITVALALVGLTFSHPIGAAIAVASVPLLVLAVRPALVANSALNVVVALVFPAIFCVGAFIYMSWVFPGSGWSFLTASSASLAAWAAGLPRVTGWRVIDAGLMVAVMLAFGAPVAPAAIVWVRRRPPLVAPALVLIAAPILAALLAVATGVFGEPTPVVVAAPILAAIVMIRIPAGRERMPAVMGLLALGWIGGAAALAVIDSRIARHVHETVDGAVGDRDRIDAFNLGYGTAEFEGILVDTFNAPAVVLGRGRARGLLAPQGDAFTLTMLLARIDAPFVAVPDPHSVVGAQDQLNKLFPKLYRFGTSGYRLVYQNPTWRMFERVATHAVSND